MEMLRDSDRIIAEREEMILVKSDEICEIKEVE
jgi:hypothetical protein